MTLDQIKASVVGDYDKEDQDFAAKVIDTFLNLLRVEDFRIQKVVKVNTASEKGKA